METQLTIIIVDNNLDDHQLMRYAFEETGAAPKLIFMESGMELIEHLDTSEPEELPSLVVLDSHMPEMDGVETLRRIKDNPFTKHIPVVIYTSGITSVMREKFHQNGALLVVEKGDGLPKLIEQAKFFIELIIG